MKTSPVSSLHDTAGTRAGISLHTFLTRLIWLCVLPLVLLAAWLAYDSVLTLQDRRDIEAGNLARNFALTVDQRLNSHIGALQMLAASPLLDDASRWQDLYQLAQGLRPNFGGHVILVDPGMQMLFNTRTPFGASLPRLPRPKGRAAAPTALATGKPAVGDIVFGPVAREALVAIAVPVRREGKTAFLLLATLETQVFQQRLEEVALPAGWALSLRDGLGDAIARRAPPGLDSARDVDAAGRFSVKSTRAPWTVVLEIPRERYREPLLATAAALAALILGATLIGVLGGLLASRRLGRAVAALAKTPASVVSTPDISEIATVRSLLDAAAAEHGTAEAALRESREQLQMFIEHAPAALAMFDRDMNYLNVSQRWLTDYGLGGADIIGRCHYAVFPEIPERWKAIHRRALAGEVIRAEDDPFERGDGTVQWLRWEVRPWHCSEGRVGGIVVFSEDVTARKQAEQGLRESEEWLRDALNYARVGYWELRRDGQALWSKQIYRMFGLSADFQPGPDSLCEVVHGSDCPTVIESLRHSLATGKEHHVEFRIRRQDDGEERWFECRGKPVLDKDGAPESLVGFMQDITERKRAEEEIQHLNADLERRVAERTAELTAANRELDAFAYAVSHDLRGPLRAMSGFSHALAEDYGGQLQGEALRYLEQIDTASGHMSELIDGLLALSRSTRGEMRHEAVDLSALCRRLLDELARGDPDRRVAAEVEPGLMARGDGRMLEVVMRNLLGNAWKYSAHAAAPSIRVVAEARGGEAREGESRFCVVDNGAGFDMAHAGKLFQPFQRLHRQDEFPGLGIGLATVQRIVHRHGGVIEARGAPGQGAVFCFSLSGRPGDAPADAKEAG